MEEVRKVEEPCARRLFKAVEGFVKASNMCGVSRICEADGLLTIDLLGEITMKEDVLDVHLTNRPHVGCGDAEEGAYSCQLNDVLKFSP